MSKYAKKVETLTTPLFREAELMEVFDLLYPEPPYSSNLNSDNRINAWQEWNNTRYTMSRLLDTEAWVDAALLIMNVAFNAKPDMRIETGNHVNCDDYLANVFISLNDHTCNTFNADIATALVLTVLKLKDSLEAA